MSFPDEYRRLCIEGAPVGGFPSYRPERPGGGGDTFRPGVNGFGPEVPRNGGSGPGPSLPEFGELMSFIILVKIKVFQCVK